MGERGQRTVLWAVRIALVLAIAFSVAFPDLPQFEGKGMAFRAPFYLLPMAVVPIGWRVGAGLAIAFTRGRVAILRPSSTFR